MSFFSLFRKGSKEPADSGELVLAENADETYTYEETLPVSSDNAVPSSMEIQLKHEENMALINAHNEEIQCINNALNTANVVTSAVTGTVHKALDVYKTSKIVEQNIAAIQSRTTVELANIAAKYTLCEKMMMATFGERSHALQKHYAVLDNALQSNDRELIIASLKGISSIVVENPLEDFVHFVSQWENNSKSNPLELDF